MSTSTIDTHHYDFQAELQQRITEKKKGKQEISDSEFFLLNVLRFLIVGGNGAFNALYGWSLGYNILSCVLLATVMFSGDWVLSLLHQIGCSQYASRGGALLTKAGLIFLSLVAGTSFMLGVKHAQEVRNSQIPLLQSNIARLNQVYEQTHNTKARVAREKEQEKLHREKQRVGDFSPANALPHYLSQVFRYSYQHVAIVLNMTWIAVLLFTGMSLSAQLGSVWCHRKELALARDIIKREKLRNKIQAQHEKVLSERKKIGTPKKKTPVKKNLPFPVRSPTRDTQTDGYNQRFQEVRDAVESGKIKPSIQGIRKFAKCGTATAQDYKKALQVHLVS